MRWSRFKCFILKNIFAVEKYIINFKCIKTIPIVNLRLYCLVQMHTLWRKPGDFVFFYDRLHILVFSNAYCVNI